MRCKCGVYVRNFKKWTIEIDLQNLLSGSYVPLTWIKMKFAGKCLVETPVWNPTEIESVVKRKVRNRQTDRHQLVVLTSYYPLVLKEWSKTVLLMFSYLRRIYGPVRQGMEWRTRNNEKIDNILRKYDIIRFAKARRISWIGQVERMEDSRMPKRVMREKIYTKRRRGRPKVRWLDDVQEDLRATGIEGWRGKAQDRVLWRRVAQEAKAHEGLQSQVKEGRKGLMFSLREH